MPSLDMPAVNLLGSNIAITNFEQLPEDIHQLVQLATPAYVCFATAHMIVSATRAPAIRDAYRDAAFISPDGVPVAWVLRILGARTSRCVSGPRAMPTILAMASDKNIRVGFYGGRPETLRLLNERITRDYPHLQVVYNYSPPFRPLSFEEEEMHAVDIRRSGVQILFVGLGSPRQECWMHRERKRLDCVCLGVGAAFEFFTGEKHLPPVWIQALGLTWLIRLLQEPRRLLGRNLYSLVFVYLALIWIGMSERQRAAWETAIKQRLTIQGVHGHTDTVLEQIVTR